MYKVEIKGYMNYIGRILLIFFIVSMPLFIEGTPHLILYFDINKTLIASDKVSNKSIEDVLNELLAEKYEACWDGSLQDPITFTDYVNKILVPGSSGDQELQTQKRFYLQHFIDYLQEHNHPLYPLVLQEYETAWMALKTSNGMIFSSFYSLLKDLDQKEISYSIILRSFGEEVFDVKTEINALYGMIFNQMGKFREGKLFLEEEESIEDSRAIYNRLRRIKHTAIHDDWNYSNLHGMSAKYGKPFYIDREDHETLPIFFDDNIRENDSLTNIIAPLDYATGELLSVKELVASGQAVRVETLQAILNVDYYINHVEDAISKHSYPD